MPPMSEPEVWQVSVVLRATEAEVRQTAEAIARVLCSDESHDGPCPIPWAMRSSRVDDIEDQDQAAALRALVSDE
jgi:hypothetical protein